MATEELLTEQFQFLGISVQKEVLAKCVSLCEEYEVDAETFVEQWMAFSLTNLNGLPPNLDSLDSLERKEFSKRADRLNAPVKDARTSTGTSAAAYGASVATQPDNEVLSKYMTATPKRIKVEDTSHQHEITAATYSPKTGAPSKYSTRANAGTVLHSYGDDELLQVIATPNAQISPVHVTQLPNHDGELYTKAIFTCRLYDGQTEHINVSEVRIDLFASKNKLVTSLPPTSAALYKHALRAAYQAGHIWGNALKPEVSTPCPSSWGWTKEKESWSPEWSAVTAIWSQLSLLDHCGCKSGCETMRCGCRRVSLPCTAQCKSCKGGCTNQKIGFELLPEKASIYDNHISYVSRHIMKKAGITEASSVRHKTQTEVTVAGRIECDADARLNPKCVVLQGTWEHSLSQAVPVDLDGLKQYSLFPGQVVVMRGTNPRGDKFLAQEVFCDGSLPIPDHRADIINALQGTLSMVVAAGPYTTSDNLSYEPLKDLIAYISTHKPQVVIMMGPFMDADHANIKDDSLNQTYKSLFEKLMDSLGELGTSCPSTKIYIVPSYKDAFHLNIFPCPPYSSRRKHPHIQWLPDPSSLNIGGVVVAATSADVLLQLGQEEISQGMGGDKLSRMASHVISQQCYNPLYPAPASQPTDAALWSQHAQLPATPHVLLLPSNFRYFVKEVNGTVVVNPERLSKGPGGGTFARLLIKVDGDCRRVAAQIVRI